MSSATVGVENQGTMRLVVSSVFTILCTVLGAGILALPNDIALCGWVFGSVMICFFGVLASVACYGLTKVTLDLQDQDSSWHATYPSVGEKTLGVGGKWAVILSQDMTCFLIATLYAQTGGHEIRNMFEKSGVFYLFGETTADSNHAGWVYTGFFVLFTGTIMIVYRGFREAPWLSIGGALMTIITAFLCVIAALTTGPPADVETTWNVAPVGFWESMGGVADLATAYGCAIVIPTLLDENPRRANLWAPVASVIAVGITTALYLLVAIVGYGVYGNYIITAGGGNILDVLGYCAPAVVAWVLMTLHFVAGFFVLNTPLMLQIEEALGVPRPYDLLATSDDMPSAMQKSLETGAPHVKSPSTSPKLDVISSNKCIESSLSARDVGDKTRMALTPKQRLTSILVRVGVILVEVFVGIMIPFFGDLLMLAGAFAILAAGFALPILFYVVHFWTHLPVMTKAFSIFLIVFCVFGMITGTYTAIDTIIKDASTYVFF